jgi:hypothetical protein
VEGWYPVGPGRDWKGRIGKAVILLDCSRVGGAKNVRVAFTTVAGPRLIGDSLLRFEVRNVEPWYGYDFHFEVLQPLEEKIKHGVAGAKRGIAGARKVRPSKLSPGFSRSQALPVNAY